MSETSATYLAPNALEQSQASLQAWLDNLQSHPDVSPWLKKAITELWARDTEEALDDLHILHKLLQRRQEVELLTLARQLEYSAPLA